MTKQVNEQVGGREIWKIATSTSLNRVHPYYHISSHRGFRKKTGKIICFASRNGCTETQDIQRGSVFVREVQMNDWFFATAEASIKAYNPSNYHS